MRHDPNFNLIKDTEWNNRLKMTRCSTGAEEQISKVDSSFTSGAGALATGSSDQI